jgi:phosphomannomutase|tara:strand:+ start:755 stop:1480 length:726 start_codon:yes stop_codon:yes gene_type:complete
MNRFIFDVDGTLTPSRQSIDPLFKTWFTDFICNNKVWLVTGSDYLKTVEQLGKEICERVVTCYSCSGNETRFKGKIVNAHNFTVSNELRSLMEGWLHASKFPLRTGVHIEERRGTVNFSIVGRNATMKERQLYVTWDKDNRERESIAFQINSTVDNVTATIGGDTGIDIYPTGHDKSQILADFDKLIPTYFFGDKIEPGGNDYPLAKALKDNGFKGTSTQVKNWKDTWERLQYLQEAKIAS